MEVGLITKIIFGVSLFAALIIININTFRTLMTLITIENYEKIKDNKKVLKTMKKLSFKNLDRIKLRDYYVISILTFTIVSAYISKEVNIFYISTIFAYLTVDYIEILSLARLDELEKCND